MTIGLTGDLFLFVCGIAIPEHFDPFQGATDANCPSWIGLIQSS
jgi:hypothetical protein